MWHIFFFQIPWLPEIFLGGHDLARLSDVFTSLRQKGSHVFGEDDLEAYKYNLKNFGPGWGGIRTAADEQYHCRSQFRANRLLPASAMFHPLTADFGPVWSGMDPGLRHAETKESNNALL
ncbi:hypothetical protein LSH36_58g21011 [Paralvinella palmiformis]|uniref:Uncharacterized protein n=1 Tax=Paralvinella palmiformis TaxID=53620 RepID=A0AAD9NCF5_9ANNE|nr:hypothetical protein LSH36_58g21011 [Paralvinella palmiformis]